MPRVHRPPLSFLPGLSRALSRVFTRFCTCLLIVSAIFVFSSPSTLPVHQSSNVLTLRTCPSVSQAPNTTTYHSTMASLMTIPTEIRMKIWECAISEEVETILQYADPHGIDAALLLPTNPALPLSLVCQMARDEIMTMSKPVLSIVIDDLDMLEALQLSAYCTQKAIGRITFIGHYFGDSEARVDWWSRLEEQNRTLFVRNCYSEWKIVRSILGRNEHIGGDAPYGTNRKSYEIQFEVSSVRERSWNMSFCTNEYRGIYNEEITFTHTMPGCERLGAARMQLLNVRVQLSQAAQEEQRLARRLAQDG